MFVSFDNAFKAKENKNKIPEVVLEYLNRELNSPTLRYISDDNGHCVITSINGEYSLSGIEIELTSEMRDVLGNTPSLEDLQKYSYNSQTEIPIKMKEDGYVILNGTKIPIDEIDFDPFNKVKYISGSFVAFPKKMDEHIMLKMGGEEEEISMNFTRIPDNSLNWKVFESDKNKPIKFVIKINLSEQKMVYRVTYDLTKAKSTKEGIEAVDIYNAFASGEGKVNGVRLNVDQDKKGKKAFSKEQILFWKKVMELEKKLEINLNPFTEKITDMDVYIGEILYRTLICKTPVRIRENIVSIKGTANVEKMEENISFNEPMAFYFQDHSETEIFGQQIKLCGIKAMYNCRVDKFEENEGEFELILKDESEEKHKYTVAMYFVKDKELEQFVQEHNVIEEFHDAKVVGEYYSVL